jgi:hypothetical protein
MLRVIEAALLQGAAGCTAGARANGCRAAAGTWAFTSQAAHRLQLLKPVSGIKCFNFEPP